MKIELISVIGLLLCLAIIGLENILFYRLAERQDEHKSRIDNIKRRLKIHVEGVLMAPTSGSRNAEIKALAGEIGGDYEVYEIAMASIKSNTDSRYSDDAETLEKLIVEINDQVHPAEIYAKMLEEGDVYRKSYACRKLAGLDAHEYRDEIRECVKSKERELSYNAAMALCTMGDVHEVADYLLRIQDDRFYSGRIIDEFFAKFTGDRQELAELLMDKCNKYMKCTIIKSIAPYRFDAFRPIYLKGAMGDDSQMKISCVKALAAFGYPEDEQFLQIAAGDKDWVIRSSAIRGLSLLKSRSALSTVKHALSDKEWWVRQAAAQAITKMDISPGDLEEILSGYDRFAADAVKNVLYRQIDTE